MEIFAKKRNLKGSKVKVLREDGLLPAVLFSKKKSQKGEPSEELVINLKDFKKVYKEAGESTLVTLKIDGEYELEKGDRIRIDENTNTENLDIRKILITEVQKDPITLEPVHVSFYEVDMSEKITARIPVEVIGEEECEPIQSGEGMVLVQLDEIEVECLPQDLPQNFEVDISGLKEVNDVLTVGEAIKVDSEKIEIKHDPEDVLLKIDYAEQLEVEEEEMSVEDIEVTSEKQEGEGEEGETESAGEPNKSEEEKSEE